MRISTGLDVAHTLPLVGVSGMLDMLRQRATPFVFLTNNSTRSRASFAKKFHQLGLDWVRRMSIMFHDTYLKVPANRQTSDKAFNDKL